VGVSDAVVVWEEVVGSSELDADGVCVDSSFWGIVVESSIVDAEGVCVDSLLSEVSGSRSQDEVESEGTAVELGAHALLVVDSTRIGGFRLVLC
jgi:hypothetical protein